MERELNWKRVEEAEFEPDVRIGADETRPVEFRFATPGTVTWGLEAPMQT